MELIYGKFSESIENEVFSRIKSALASGEKTIVIVPAQAMFLMEDLIIKRCGVSGFFTLEVVSFERLTEKIFEKAGGRAAELMSVSGAAMMVRRAIDELSDGLRVMNGKNADVHEEAARIILALKAEDITPEMMDELSAQSSGVTADKLHDIAAVYRRLSEYGKNNVWDQNDAEEYARQLISGCEYIKGAKVIIHGFDVLPASRIRTINRLLLAGCDVLVALEADESDDIFKMQNRTIYALEGAARAAGAAFRRTYLPEPAHKNADILHMEKQLFAYPTVKYEGTPRNIRLIKAKNKKEEVLFAAGEALKAAKEGISFSEIGILAGTPSDYMPYITDVFERNGIGYFYDGKRGLNTHKLASFVLSGVKLAASRNWGRRDAIMHLKAGFLNISEKDADRVLKYADEHGLKGNAFRYQLKNAPEEIEAIRAAAFGDIAKISSSASKTDAAGLAGLMRGYIDSLGAEERLAEFSKRLDEMKMGREARFAAQVYSRVDMLLEQASLLLTGMHASRLYDVLKSGFESADIAVVPPMTNEITIGDISHSIFPRKKLLIVLGANDGALPAAAEGGIFSEYEVNRLNETAFFPGHTAIEDQRQFIRRAFTSAERLAVFYNEESGPPALIVDRLKRIFPELNKTAGTAPLTVNGSLNALAAEIRDSLDGASESRSMAAEYMAAPEGREKLSVLMRIALGGNGARRIDAAAAQKIYRNAKASVSRVETFCKCPYKHFIQYGIRPERTDRFEENAINSGLYVHSIIESVTKEAAKKGFSAISGEELSRIADEAAQREIKVHNRGIFSDSNRYAVTEAYLRDEAKKALMSVKKQLSDENVKMLDSEMDFAEGGRLYINAPGGKIEITGKIDRADVIKQGGQSYVRVIDYKTGGRPFELKELYAGTNIQLAVYLIALIEKFSFKPGCGYYMNVELKYSEDGKDAEPALYGFSIDDIIPAKDKKRGLSEGQMDILLGHVRDIMGEIMNRIASGEDDMTPNGEDACKYCDYKPICRFDESFGGNAYREADGGLAEFLENCKI